MVSFVLGRARRVVPEEKAARLELAVEEWAANVCHHAYPEAEGTLAVSVRAEPGRFVVEIADDGRPFDPVAMRPPDVNVPLAERQPGGLGVLLIKRMLEDVRYRRERDQNIVTFVVSR